MEAAAAPTQAGGETSDAHDVGMCGKCKLARSKPEIPMYAPYNIHVEPGKEYRWCSCGKSKTQPWCDGSHRGTAFRPIRFTFTAEQRMTSICGCKYTTSPPYCDGTHALMPANPSYPPCQCKAPEW